MSATENQPPPGTAAGLGRKPPELLAPAGDWECARAAVENGADAIYFGLDRFNARMRAKNFTEADLPELMGFLHVRGVRGYVTLNTLIFTHELHDASQYIKSIISAGVDAVIVQDVGICRLIRKLSPDFPIHASTQMTITSAAGVEFARELGCQLVVLARECSLKEIEKIQAAQKESAATQLPLEVFVHGALCVAYSGQCLTSESLGGRSANRGECAQACRMPYDLISDAQVVDLGDRQYLLSPQDLSGVEVLPDLIRLGLTSLKIEGRLKSPEYVANITRVYRTTLDKLVSSNKRQEPAEIEQLGKDLYKQARYDLEMGFSRGLYTGWFKGINNQELAHARFGKKRGVYLGDVVRVAREAVGFKPEAPLKAGDGIVFDAGHPDQKEEGGRIFKVFQREGLTWIEFGRNAVALNKVAPGQKIWKTSDPELDRRTRQTYQGPKPQFDRPLEMEVYGDVGQAMTLLVRDELGHVVHLSYEKPLEAAQSQPLTGTRLQEQLGRLGGTGFVLKGIQSRLSSQVILPVSELNRMRRAAVDQLLALRKMPKRWTLVTPEQDPTVVITPKTDLAADAELVVLVRDLAQLEALLVTEIRRVYCEFEDPKKYRDAVKLFRERQSSHPVAGREIFVAPPRIFKMGEEWILKQVRSSEADGYLVRNVDHLQFFGQERMVGDFSLNVANPLTAQYFIDRYKLERLTASYDLNIEQLQALLDACDPRWFEITLHQHMPMFHMEHCVFCAFLSTGTDYTNCGRPCDKHAVRLRDRVGAEHPLRADAGCRNTVFNARAQTGAEFYPELFQRGARMFRLEFVSETPEEMGRILDHYRDLLAGRINGADLWRHLKLQNQLGVTRGQLEKVG